MPREVIGPVTRQKLFLELARLEKIRSTMLAVAEGLPANEELYTFRLRSLRDGLKLLESFEPELEKSFRYYMAGEAFDEDTTKEASATRQKYHRKRRRRRQPAA